MKVIWTRRAGADKDAIWNFLADSSVRLAERVERRSEERAAVLGQLPRQGRPIEGGRRELSIPDVQYIIDYSINEDAVRILHVWHTAQDRRA